MSAWPKASTGYLIADISRESYEPINPDIQDNLQGPSGFEVDGWCFGAMINPSIAI
jgi:hypothetical protein